MKDVAPVLLVTGLGFAILAAAVFVAGDRSVLTSPPDAVAEGFIRQLGMERYALAERFLTTDLQSDISPATLRETFEPLRARIGRPDQVETKTSWVNRDEARVLATYDGRQDDVAMYVDLVREQELWKVAQWPLDVVGRKAELRTQHEPRTTNHEPRSIINPCAPFSSAVMSRRRDRCAR